MEKRMRYFWQARPWQAFKSFAIIFSFVVNLVLLLVLFLGLPLILPALDSVARPLVNGLTNSFEEMGDARIVRTISIEETIPIQFDVPLDTTTTVVLSEPVPLSVPATFNLPGGGGTINGTVSLQLPAGMRLPVAMSLSVPVSETVPISLEVAVDIPMRETELAQPFNNLQQLFTPLDAMLEQLPASNEELRDRIGERGSESRPSLFQAVVAGSE